MLLVLECSTIRKVVLAGKCAPPSLLPFPKLRLHLPPVFGQTRFLSKAIPALSINFSRVLTDTQNYSFLVLKDLTK